MARAFVFNHLATGHFESPVSMYWQVHDLTDNLEKEVLKTPRIT